MDVDGNVEVDVRSDKEVNTFEGQPERTSVQQDHGEIALMGRAYVEEGKKRETKKEVERRMSKRHEDHSCESRRNDRQDTQTGDRRGREKPEEMIEYKTY